MPSPPTSPNATACCRACPGLDPGAGLDPPHGEMEGMAGQDPPYEVNMQQFESHACFGGTQQVWSHRSDALDCEMKFAIYLPPQAAHGPVPALYWLSGLT